VIWGASVSGADCLQKYQQQGIEVLYFVDRRATGNELFKGIPLFPVEHLLADKTSTFDAVILAMSIDPSKPKLQLRDAGISQFVINFRVGAEVTTEVQNYVSPYQLLQADSHLFLQVINDFIIGLSQETVVSSTTGLLSILLENFPSLKNKISCSINDKNLNADNNILPSLKFNDLTGQNYVILILEPSYLESQLTLSILQKDCPDCIIYTLEHIFSLMPVSSIPANAVLSIPKTIYPIDLPRIKLNPETDFVLLDLPPRFFAMMPNGLGYVHNMLEQQGIAIETLDLDLIFYHQYHARRIFDGLEPVISADGYEMKADPWSVDVINEEWEKPEVLKYFQQQIDKLIAALVIVQPKIIGLSLHHTNLDFSRAVVQRIRNEVPDVKIIVGGYDCIRPEFGSNLFDDFDYMVIFEAEMTLPGLVKQLLEDKQPKNLPGIISKYDNSDFPFVPGPLLEDLDAIPFPKYQWADVSHYANYNGFQLTPIVLSRGCRWSRCTFCAERFNWRRRDPLKVVDEIEWFVNQGRTSFVFNDSDLSGDPEAVRKVCEEVINRGLKGLSFTGQLRVQKGYSQEYFDIIAKAGFQTLTYGIDGWSKNTLWLHKKGYTVEMIEDVIKYTFNAGITVSMNLVIGIPHETEQDIDETIDNIIKNKKYIEGIENLNPIILSTGSIYWETPEKFGIHFRKDKDLIYRENVKKIPYDDWYSTEPYIDQDIRLDRVNRIVKAAQQAGVRIGGYADWKLKLITQENQ